MALTWAYERKICNQL